MSAEASDRRAEPVTSPYDTPASSGLRFAVELVTWSAGPWAAAEIAGHWWAALPALFILLALPSVFSTPGDKNQIIVATPGPVRLMIELGLSAVAVAGAWVAWPEWAAIAATVLVVAALATGRRRARWLLDGAPST